MIELLQTVSAVLALGPLQPSCLSVSRPLYELGVETTDEQQVKLRDAFLRGEGVGLGELAWTRFGRGKILPTIAARLDFTDYVMLYVSTPDTRQPQADAQPGLFFRPAYNTEVFPLSTLPEASWTPEQQQAVSQLHAALEDYLGRAQALREAAAPQPEPVRVEPTDDKKVRRLISQVNALSPAARAYLLSQITP